MIRLYDRQSDPYCHHEVTAQHPRIAARLRKALVGWLCAVPEQGDLTGAVPTAPAAREDLTALGYAADEPGATRGALIDPECACPECKSFR
jgi:hypothetical protein